MRAAVEGNPGSAAMNGSRRLKAKAMSDNPLNHPSFAGACQAASDAEVEFPVRSGVDIQGRKDQMMLIVRDFEVSYRSGRGVIFDARLESPGHGKGDFDSRLEFKAAIRIESTE